MSKLTNSFISLYGSKLSTWVKPNEIVLTRARQNNLVVGGSIALAITCKRAKKEPGDIDLFTNSFRDAMNFVLALSNDLKNKKIYYQILINNHTDILLPGVSNWIKIKVPFWKDICVMVLEKEIRYFRWIQGLNVQYFDDVVASAKITSERDGKDRTSHLKETSNLMETKYTPIDVLKDDFMNEEINDLPNKTPKQTERIATKIEHLKFLT